MTDDDQHRLGEKLARMEILFNEAIKTDITTHAIDFLCRARLLLRITDHDPHVAKDAIHTAGGYEAASREWDALDQAQRVEIGNEVMDHWATVTTDAVRKLWHAAEVLGFKPDTIDPKHVALTAATYLGSDQAGAGD